ncbi:DNA polymerase III subunit beta [Nitratiruptor sp. YY08-26]|uniref:DNA polymerase III subunit beta n=1 Tax=unclassified Nitratiruptor TaxID=2624044 RepID=UPI001916424A|nr:MULTISPECIES: DNA polymerase III subunit beta [unclassified Nitratiruptor]BCD61169.1 DNA polymerase III subunit beta [Nitratiruptor sp. YY08-13]BCD65102.1 DNA polymerase III subunit beta [Nitratiruptor sp. YY08-26]
MKIEMQKSLLEQILSQMQPFLEKKDLSQITSHVYLAASNGILTIKATDYETGLKTQTDSINLIKEGKATANGKKFLDIVRILKDGTITIETRDDHLQISQNQSKFKLPMFDAEQFPKFPEIDAMPKIAIESDKFISSLKKITPAIDNNNPKFELNGALIDIKSDRINFVATDTKRLALVTLLQNMDKEFNLIIPKKAIIEIQKLFFDEIDMHYDETYFILKNNQYLFFTKLISGKYPDYERILPKSLQYEMTLPKDKMIEAIKQITIISNEIKLTFLKDRIIFKNLSQENIEAQTELEVETPFEEKFIMAVNSRYILDFLTHIEDNEFLMGINEPELPFELKKENFITIVMPIVI